MHVNLGDLPSWFVGVGTVGTLIAATWQIGSERKRRLKQDAADRKAARRRQASLVACWVGDLDDKNDPGPMSPWFGGTTTPIMLTNGSGEPVYDVVIALTYLQGAGAPGRIEDWKSRADESHDAPWSTVAILPPGRWVAWVPALAGIKGWHFAWVPKWRSPIPRASVGFVGAEVPSTNSRRRR